MNYFFMTAMLCGIGALLKQSGAELMPRMIFVFFAILAILVEVSKARREQ